MSKRKWTVMLNAKCIIFYPLFGRAKTLPYRYKPWQSVFL